MMMNALDICIIALAGAVSFFQQMIDAIPGSQLIIISSITMFMTVRYLLMPFLGASMGSDSVKKKKAKEG